MHTIVNRKSDDRVKKLYPDADKAIRLYSDKAIHLSYDKGNK